MAPSFFADEPPLCRYKSVSKDLLDIDFLKMEHITALFTSLTAVTKKELEQAIRSVLEDREKSG